VQNGTYSYSEDEESYNSQKPLLDSDEESKELFELQSIDSCFKSVFHYEIKDYQFIITLGLDEKQEAKHIKFQYFEQYIIQFEENIDISTMKYKREIYKMIDMASNAG
jgi:hypothetical protein